MRYLSRVNEALEGGHRELKNEQQLLGKVKQLSVTELGAHCGYTEGSDVTYVYRACPNVQVQHISSSRVTCAWAVRMLREIMLPGNVF